MEKLENWTEVSKGYYRFVIAANVAYEIFIECWYLDTPILTAKGSLCLVGKWNRRDGSSSLEREWILKEQPLQMLLEAAVKDNQENNTCDVC